jgi:hypothetical protein
VKDRGSKGSAASYLLGTLPLSACAELARITSENKIEKQYKRGFTEKSKRIDKEEWD